MVTSDYIKPGEFSFCPRGGRAESCQLGDAAELCRGCYPCRPQVNTEEDIILENAKEKCGLILFEARERIARERKRQGMLPNFWMGTPTEKHNL